MIKSLNKYVIKISVGFFRKKIPKLIDKIINETSWMTLKVPYFIYVTEFMIQETSSISEK